MLLPPTRTTFSSPSSVGLTSSSSGSFSSSSSSSSLSIHSLGSVVHASLAASAASRSGSSNHASTRLILSLCASIPTTSSLSPARFHGEPSAQSGAATLAGMTAEEAEADVA
jgi:hypothetical protein